MTTPFFDNIQPNIFQSIFNLYQQAKNQATLSFRSGYTFDLKILQSDWLRAFWPTSHEPDFS